MCAGPCRTLRDEVEAHQREAFDADYPRDYAYPVSYGVPTRFNPPFWLQGQSMCPGSRILRVGRLMQIHQADDNHLWE